jgi:hypothetical protein
VHTTHYKEAVHRDCHKSPVTILTCEMIENQHELSSTSHTNKTCQPALGNSSNKMHCRCFRAYKCVSQMTVSLSHL